MKQFRNKNNLLGKHYSQINNINLFSYEYLHLSFDIYLLSGEPAKCLACHHGFDDDDNY